MPSAPQHSTLAITRPVEGKDVYSIKSLLPGTIKSEGRSFLVPSMEGHLRRFAEYGFAGWFAAPAVHLDEKSPLTTPREEVQAGVLGRGMLKL